MVSLGTFRSARIAGLMLLGMWSATASAPLRAQTPDPVAPGATANGTPVEVLQDRYPNGQLRVERHVIRDQAGNFVNHGLWTAWRSDGNKIGGGEFDQGKRQGVWTRWFDPGESPLLSGPVYRKHQGPYFSEGTYVDGELHGPWIIYDAHKQKISHWEFDGGQQHGVWTWWYPNGQKEREMFFDHARPIGDVTQWSPDGQVIEQFSYVNGRRKVWKEASYYPGQKHWEGWYLEPEEVTKSTYDWWQGAAETTVVRVIGKPVRHGQWVWWHPNGQKQTAGKYVIGVTDGPWIWWHPNGQKWVEGSYVSGEKVAAWTTWDPAGVVEKREEFAAAPAEAPLEVPAAPVSEPIKPATPAPTTVAPTTVAPTTTAPTTSAPTTAPVVSNTDLSPEEAAIIKPRPNLNPVKPEPIPSVGGGVAPVIP